MNAVENAKQLAATIGAKQFWTVYEEVSGAWIISDPAAQCAAEKGRYMVTDSKAIELARKAGVVCNDDGLIG